MELPRLYAIADVELLQARGPGLPEFAAGLRRAEVGMVQLRFKGGSPREVLAAAAVLKDVFRGSGTLLVMNDRADLAQLAGFDGVHVGQGDLSVADVRLVMGPEAIVGVSTHTLEEALAADRTDAEYVAIGPVFRTGTKLDAAAVVGLEGVRQAREATRKPLVAIGGVTVANCRSVIEAGAESVAVISALLPDAAGEFVRRLRAPW